MLFQNNQSWRKKISLFRPGGVYSLDIVLFKGLLNPLQPLLWYKNQLPPLTLGLAQNLISTLSSNLSRKNL